MTNSEGEMLWQNEFADKLRKALRNEQKALYRNNGDYDDFQPGQHYLELSRTERDLVDLVTSNFDDVILVYNGANMLELDWVADYPQIKSVLLCAGAGATGFNALGNIISGEVNPSGKTAWERADGIVSFVNYKDRRMYNSRQVSTIPSLPPPLPFGGGGGAHINKKGC